MEMVHYNQQQQQQQQVNHGRSLSHTSSSSDLNHSSSSNSISISMSNSNSNHQNQGPPPPQWNQHQHQHQREADPMQSWWESVSKARSRTQALLALLPPHQRDSDALSSLADSDRPARTLLDSSAAYSALSSSLSGSGDDPLCQWLYDTFQQSSDSDSDSDLRLVVLSFIPVLSGLYLSRVHTSSTVSPTQPSPSLAGFEAVLLAVYTSQTKARAGKPLLVSIPTPAYLNQHPSLYHQPPPDSSSNNSKSSSSADGIGVGVVSPPLEPQVGIKSTKRGCIVGVAFHCFYQHISQMPSWSKLDLCRFAAAWAGSDCPCATSLDLQMGNFDEDADANGFDVTLSNGGGDAVSFSPSSSPRTVTTTLAVNGEIVPSKDIGRLQINDNCVEEDPRGCRIPLPWELLQPVLRILGHCLLAPLNSEEVKNAAGVAVRRLYARASHDLCPQAIIASRSLVQIHNHARAASKAAALANPSSNATTPRPKKPEVLLVSK